MTGRSSWWNENWQGNRSTRRRPAPVPHFPPNIQRDLTWYWTRRGGKPATYRLSCGTAGAPQRRRTFGSDKQLSSKTPHHGIRFLVMLKAMRYSKLYKIKYPNLNWMYTSRFLFVQWAVSSKFHKLSIAIKVKKNTGVGQVLTNSVLTGVGHWIHFNINLLCTHPWGSPPVSNVNKMYHTLGDHQLLRKASTLSWKIACLSLLTYPPPLCHLYRISRDCLILGNTCLDFLIRIPERFGKKEDDWRW
jgi:hypothetical protein